MYCSPSSVRALIRKIEHPLRMVKDLEERELLWGRAGGREEREIREMHRHPMADVVCCTEQSQRLRSFY